MATMTVSGLSSGIDFDSLIQKLIQVERLPVDRLESQKSDYEQKRAAYSDLTAKVDALEAAADALRNPVDFGDKAVLVGDETAFTANASSAATTGQYRITVLSLALEHKMVSGNGLASSETAVASGAGLFTFKVGEDGTEYSVNVDAEMTLEEFKDSLNGLDAGLNAVIVNEGTGANPYRLILSTQVTGEESKIIVTRDDTSLGFPVNDTELTSGLHLQRPQNASLQVDGLTVERTSNTFSDLIPGVTLSLHKADPSASVTLEVSEDREAVGERVRELIESYNAVVNFVSARSQYDFEKHSGDPLYAEGTVQSLLRGMSRIVTSGVAGLPSELKALSQIGVKTNRDGTLSLDEAKLQKALDENLEGVEHLFVQNGTTAGVGEQLYQFAFGATRSGDGSLSIRTGGLQEGIRNLGRKIEDQEAALDRYEVRLRAQFAALESLITSFQAQDQFFTTSTNASA